MKSLTELLNQPALDDSAIASALKEIELEVLAKALVGLEQVSRDIFYRNASYSSRKHLSKLVASYDTLEKAEIVQSQAVINSILEKYLHTQAPHHMVTHESQPPPLEIRSTNKHEIFASLLDLSRQSHDYGLLSLEAPMRTIDDSYLENFFIKKGLEYIVSGRDKKTSFTMLTHLKKYMIRKIEDHLDMILAGISHIHKGSSNKELVKELKKYL